MTNIERRRFLQGAAALTVGSVLVGATGQSAQAAPAPEALTGAPATRRLRFDTPGRKDFPKVGGNFGNQNYSALGRIHPGNVRHLGGAGVNRIDGGPTTGSNRPPRSRSTVCCTSSPRWAMCSRWTARPGSRSGCTGRPAAR